MELRQLRYFVEIAEQASFTRAAETLAIAQPALTAQMHKLEAEFGAPLFIRTKRGITLTDVGRATLASARTTLHAADATKRLARQTAELAGARVNVAYSRTFPVAQLARIVRGFRRERPDLELDLREMWSLDQVEAVADGSIDFGFRQIRGRERSRLAERGIVAVKTSEETLALAVPGTHPLATRRTVTLAELANEHFISIAVPPAEAVRQRVFEAMEAAGFQPKITQEVADVRLLLGLVSAEMGVAIVFAWNRDVRMRNVHYLRIVPEVSLSFGVMYRRGYGGRAIEPLLRRIEREEVPYRES
jgi:DNA-binding transcriptional LysR family regulator